MWSCKSLEGLRWRRARRNLVVPTIGKLQGLSILLRFVADLFLYDIRHEVAVYWSFYKKPNGFNFFNTTKTPSLSRTSELR